MKSTKKLLITTLLSASVLTAMPFTAYAHGRHNTAANNYDHGANCSWATTESATYVHGELCDGQCGEICNSVCQGCHSGTRQSHHRTSR